MTMNDSNNQQSRGNTPGRGMGTLKHIRRPIIINRVNIVLDGDRRSWIRRARRFNGRQHSDSELNGTDRKAKRFFHQGLPRFDDAHLSPEEKRTMLEQQEK